MRGLTNAFPSGGGYKVPSWSTGTDAEIVKAVQAADEGKINLSDYWAVGDERTVHLSAMAATGVGESHVEQDVTFVLMDTACTGFTFAEATASGKTTPSFIVGMKNCLEEVGYMNPGSTNANGWSGCARRVWCNNIFYAALPNTLRGIFKQFKWKQGKGGGVTSGLLETTDYFGLAPEKAIFENANFSQSDEAALYSQFDWYKTLANKIKKLGDAGSANVWREGSTYSGNSLLFCAVSSDGSAHYGPSAALFGISPFGCI